MAGGKQLLTLNDNLAKYNKKGMIAEVGSAKLLKVCPLLPFRSFPCQWFRKMQKRFRKMSLKGFT
jgi:uncharacterized protein YhdP